VAGDIVVLDEIRRIYMFQGLESEQLDAVLRGASRHELDAGETLFRHGVPADRFYWVRRGLIKLTRLSAEGEEKVVELIMSGQTFGEAIMFMDRQIYPVNAEAIEPCEVIGFDSRQFRELLRGSVDVCFRLLANLSMRLHHHVNEIDRLTLHNATTRVVSFLVDQERSGAVVQLAMPKHLLASRLSIQPETLSRIFARLGKEGLIRVDGHNVHLVDEAKLRAYLE
jgi:CRP-like cAMP-binding protein